MDTSKGVLDWWKVRKTGGVDGVESPPSARIAADNCPARKGEEIIEFGVGGDAQAVLGEAGDEQIEDMRIEAGNLG